MLAFCSAKPIWMPKKPKLIFHSPQKPWRGRPSDVVAPVSSPISFIPAIPILRLNFAHFPHILTLSCERLILSESLPSAGPLQSAA